MQLEEMFSQGQLNELNVLIKRNKPYFFNYDLFR